MTSFLDTSVVIRYLTGQLAEQLETARGIIDVEDELLVTDLVLAEAAWVMRSVCRIDREDIVDGLISFLQKDNITVHGLETPLVIGALLLSRQSNRVSVADALLWAVARSEPEPTIFSFDRRFPSDGVAIRRS